MRLLPELKKADKIKVKNFKRPKWLDSEIIEKRKCQPRSYTVKVFGTNNIVVRNRSHLIQVSNQNYNADSTEKTHYMSSNNNNVPDYDFDLTSLHDDVCSLNNDIPDYMVDQDNIVNNSNIITISSRVIKPPQKLDL
ncbi:hypothetical protein ILUMI_24040 [Ignelater luminosus]|uniref:Uncharacterized protein n=1 Tax=Ignelater luminosus TaxID=2038154 RepID=A0A8K0G197_IGNLU|nr:hypothetical protein ILUMI_24040 [Ignelater luminosus]